MEIINVLGANACEISIIILAIGITIAIARNHGPWLSIGKKED